jgi:hypothetical protein
MIDSPGPSAMQAACAKKRMEKLRVSRRSRHRRESSTRRSEFVRGYLFSG